MNDHMKPSPGGIPFPRFDESVAAANRQFSLIKGKYPQLKAYLVLSLPAGQTGVGNSLTAMIAEFPDLFLASAVRTEARNLVRELRSLEKKKENAEPQQRPKLNRQFGIVNDRLHAISSELIVDGNCRFELRFHHLDYDLVRKLQTDELVDRKLTPQTHASIRIVLGTVSQNFPL